MKSIKTMMLNEHKAEAPPPLMLLCSSALVLLVCRCVRLCLLPPLCAALFIALSAPDLLPSPALACLSRPAACC